MFYHVRIFVLLLIIILLLGIAPADELSYRSYIYNTYEIMLFSYEDDTDFEVVHYTDHYGPQYEYCTLDKGQHARVYMPQLPPIADVYEVAASNKFAVLMGDAAVNGRSGYYAIDQEGRFLSTECFSSV